MKYRPPANETLEKIRTHQLEFTFTIPSKLISARSDMDNRFLDLYPSARLGSSCHAYPTKQHYMQPFIFYRLVATIPAMDAYAQPLLRYSYCERVIKILPTRTADPPLYIRSYPYEYKLESSAKLRKHLCAPSIGELRVWAEEPMPLNLLVTTPRASTYVPVKLSFTPSNTLASGVEPYNWTIAVQSRVRLRTFYGTQIFEHVPTLGDIKSSHLRMRIESTAEEVRHYTGLRWEFDRLSPNDTAVTLNEILRSRWTTRLHATISLGKSFVPSFLTPLAALRYSVVLKISVPEMRLGLASVEVPVQVLRCPFPPRTDDNGEEPGPISEELHERDSGSFWESIGEAGVLDTHLNDQPPLYRHQ